ncbi:M48 family metallopeptidase [Megalodesulfovibrio paquesii]
MRDDLPSFTIRESARARRILLKVAPGAGLTVVLPRGVDPAFARLAVEQQADWAIKALRELRARGQLFEAPLLPHRVTLAAVDRDYRVDCLPDDPRRLTLRERQDGVGRVLAFRGRVDDAVRCVELLRGWLQQAGRRHLVPWCQEVSEELGIPVTGVRVGRQKTRWGSRSSRGGVSLNCCLLFLPREAVRYVIIHELCHALHGNHSPAYWREVAAREPDFKRLDESLKESWRHVPAWAAW